jgi:hypothetical protein
MLYFGFYARVRRGATFRPTLENGKKCSDVFVVGAIVACGKNCWKCSSMNPIVSG